MTKRFDENGVIYEHYKNAKFLKIFTYLEEK